MLSTTRGPGRPWGARAWWNLQGGATAGRRTEGTRGRRGRGSGQGRWSWPQGGPAVLQIDRYAQQDLKKGLHLYGTPGNVGLTNAWSIIQTDVRRGVAGGGEGRGPGGAGRGPGGAGPPLCTVPARLSCSSAAAESPTTPTGSRSTTPRVSPTPAAWSSARAAGCTRPAPGGKR